jgi:hypothetical protein
MLAETIKNKIYANILLSHIVNLKTKEPPIASKGKGKYAAKPNVAEFDII